MAMPGVLRHGCLQLADSMPFHYRRDDARRRITLTLTDPLTVTELVATAERQVADGGWQYALLVDARATFVALEPMNMLLFVSRLRELVAVKGPRGPVAVVTQKSAAVSAQMYRFFGGKTESFEVFWDLEDANQWLDERIGQNGQTAEPD
jgi:hypothetical protein